MFDMYSLYSRYIGLLFFLFLLACENDIITSDDEELMFDVAIGNSEIPYIVIDTEGKFISTETSISASMKIYVSKLKIQDADIGVKYTGAWESESDKKFLSVQTLDHNLNLLDVPFFGMPAHSDWKLQGQIVTLSTGYYMNRSLIYEYLGSLFAHKMEYYSGRLKPVELELNGEYQGVYMFMETPEIHENRINISHLNHMQTDPESISGGYILRIGPLALDNYLHIDPAYWEEEVRFTENNSFRSRYDINGELLAFDAYTPPSVKYRNEETYFIYEYPDAMSLGESEKMYIQSYVDSFETALITDDFSTETRTYMNYIDLESFVDYFILNELCQKGEAYRRSVYLYKDKNGKLKFGPIGDLKVAFYQQHQVAIRSNEWMFKYNELRNLIEYYKVPFWWPRLFEDPLFRLAVKGRWFELRNSVLKDSDILNEVDQIVSYLKSNGAIFRNFNRWNTGDDYDVTINSLKPYLLDRANWMDSEIARF